MTTLGKGELAEEVLRGYFLGQGYFAVRSLPFSYGQIDITDVDVWLYGKTSVFTRERINVDVKNKSNPQAFERIVWAKGLQTALQIEKSLVATTSTRKEVRDFGLANEVLIIDGNLLGNFLGKGINPERIVEESFIEEVSKESPGKGEENWKERYVSSKGRLLSKINFDGCNEYLREISYYFEQTILRSNRTFVPLRMLYINIAYFLLCLDFISKNFVTLEQKARKELLANGFNYGARGKERTESITHAAIRLASSVIANQGIARTLQSEVERQIKSRPVDILVDFFSKDLHFNQLFEMSKLFEEKAFLSKILVPSELPADMQSIIGLLADFCKIDRKKAIF